MEIKVINSFIFLIFVILLFIFIFLGIKFFKYKGIKIDFRKRKVIKGLIFILLAILLFSLLFVSVRFFKYRDIIGQYKLVSGIGYKNLELNLFSWSQGKKEDFKCSLWECSGYEHGPIYYIKDDILYLRLKQGVITTKVEVKKENGIVYIVFKNSNNNDNLIFEKE